MSKKVKNQGKGPQGRAFPRLAAKAGSGARGRVASKARGQRGDAGRGGASLPRHVGNAGMRGAGAPPRSFWWQNVGLKC